MTTDYFILLGASAASALVSSFTSESSAATPIFPRSDASNVRLRFLQKNPAVQSGRPFIDVDPSTWPSVKFGGGVIGATPNAGTFTLTSSLGGSASGAIAYNATAAAVQAALRAIGAGGDLTACTATGATGGPWSIDSNDTANGTLAITGSAVALAPDGSTVQIVKTQTANGSLTNRWIITLTKALPILLTTGWTALPSALVTPTILSVGSATVCKSYTLTWNNDAYDGGVYFTMVDKSSVSSTVGPIAFNATATDVANAFLATGVGTANTVAVQFNGPGNYTVTLIGTGLNFSNVPTITNLANTLVVPIGLQGVVTVSTAGASDILTSDPTGTITLEIEISRAVGQITTAVQVPATIDADLIGNTPGFATGTEDWATIGDVETIAPHVFANTTAKNNDTPFEQGQLGFKYDDKTLWYAASSTMGDWQQSGIGAWSWRIGSSGAADGVLTIYGGGSGATSGTLSAPAITTNRTWFLPDQSGTLLISGGPATSAYVAKTANYTTTATDGTVNCTTGSFTITLLTAVGHTGLTQVVKNSGAGTILVNTTSSQTIDGSLTQSLSAKQSITVQSDGANWILI